MSKKKKPPIESTPYGMWLKILQDLDSPYGDIRYYLKNNNEVFLKLKDTFKSYHIDNNSAASSAILHFICDIVYLLDKSSSLSKITREITISNAKLTAELGVVKAELALLKAQNVLKEVSSRNS